MADKSNAASAPQPVKAPDLANPAAVGLGAFGATTLLLQFFNFGWIDKPGVVMWLAIFFGGGAQLIAGFQEFKRGNNFGYAAFTTYGAFWLATAFIFMSLSLNLFGIAPTDIGYFFVIFTILTWIYFIGAMRQSSALSIVFLTLGIGYILLDIYWLGNAVTIGWLRAAGVVLTICAVSALYTMAHVALTPLGVKIPAGKPWMK